MTAKVVSVSSGLESESLGIRHGLSSETKGLKSATLGIACHCRVTQLSPGPLGLTPTPGRGMTRSASCLGSGARDPEPLPGGRALPPFSASP